MLTKEDYNVWCNSLNYHAPTRALIDNVRQSGPTRRVRIGHKNVSGRYPSRKMQRTIQFESHRSELAIILELEHDDDVLEYWDQPPSIKLNYETKSGKKLAILHTPDYFVMRRKSAEWIECKIEEDLLKLEERQPNRYQRNDSGGWRCPPGDEYAERYNLSYRIKSSAGIDWTFQRNVLFLEDYLRSEVLEVAVEFALYTRSLVAAQPGLSLAALLDYAKQHELSVDSIYTLIVTDQLYVDLSACALSQTEKVRVYTDQSAARLHGSLLTSPITTQPSKMQLEVGTNISWDGRVWMVINCGERQVWLQDEACTVIALDEETIVQLIIQDSIEIAAVTDHSDKSGSIATQMLKESYRRALKE